MTNGYKNECDFAKAINNRKYSTLTNTLKNFIKYNFKEVKEDDILECKRYRTKDKADVYIKLNGKSINVSLKSGIRVSVHAEKISSFVNYLEKIHINKNIINYLLLYHYGDLTLDGTGNNRIPAKELKVKYEKEIKIINKYINHKKIIKNVVTRCLFEGSTNINSAKYIYYGDINNGVYASKEEIVEYLSNNIAFEIAAPHFSSLIYQNWNRNLLYNKKIESHRYYCQFKWPSIEEDLVKIRNNYD